MPLPAGSGGKRARMQPFQEQGTQEGGAITDAASPRDADPCSYPC